MPFHVVAVGRVRDVSLRAASDDFLQRSRHYFKLSLIETRDSPKGKNRAEILAGDAARLSSAIPESSIIVALSRSGESWDSEAFASRMASWRDSARNIAFVIGGAYGLDPGFLAEADLRLSLSPLTLPHDLARLVLLEQIYRAGTIIRGEPYHKAGPGG